MANETRESWDSWPIRAINVVGMSFYKERRFGILLVIGMICYLSLLIVGMLQRDHGIFVSLQLKRECDRLRQQISNYGEENRALKQEWDRLTNDLRYVERIAREDLYMIGEHELLFLFRDLENNRAAHH